MKPDPTLEGMESVITELRPDARADGWIWVYVDDERTIRLTERSAVATGLLRGQAWTPSLCAAATLASAADRARLDARRLLAVRARSESELRTRLSGKGHHPPAVDEAIRILKSDGLVDDAALSRSMAEASLAAKPVARQAVIRRLRERGVTSTQARDAAEQAAGIRTETDLAEQALRKKIGDRAPGPTPRLYAYLLRRGFDDEAAAEALRRVLGHSPDPGDDGAEV